MKIKKLLYVGIFLLSIFLTKAQDFFKEISERTIKTESRSRTVEPQRFLTYTLDVDGLRNYFASVPELKDNDRKDHAPIIVLPMSDGKKAKFRVWKSSVMAPQLASRFPQIVTMTGQGIDDPYATIKLDFTELGFHAQIQSAVTGDTYIDPYAKNDIGNYIIYRKSDLIDKKARFCGSTGKDIKLEKKSLQKTVTPGVGNQIRIFRLAVACTHQYAAAATGSSSPTVAQTLSAIVTTVNRVNGVYEQEVAVRLVLVPTETNVVFVSATNDPFTGNDDAYTLIDESQEIIDERIGDANYDIGHTFSTGGGGLAGSGICEADYKASGITGSANPVGDPYDIDYVCHEVGHQFGGPHSFNATTSNCGQGNREAIAAVEPGSGITIMGYAGICGSKNNLAANSIPVFHTNSFQFITTEIDSLSCQVTNPVANTFPVVNAGNDYTIPKGTPFKLTGSATDMENNNTLTYSWEQNDVGPAGNWDAPVGNAPLFRSFMPKTVSYRYFPQITDIINNTTTKGEVIPSYGRTMEFRLTARDNNAGCGGVANDDAKIIVDGNSGPFKVTAPGTAVTWTGNSSQTITWDVANTTAAPVSCANVSILLSTDGGLTYPTTILASTPNDGSEVVTIPNVNTTKARIMVAGEGNVFFNINPVNFTINNQVLGVSDLAGNKDVFVLYPNPGKDIINIQFTNSNEVYDITVYDASGKLVFSKTGNKPAQDKIGVHHLSQLIKGDYLIRIKTKTFDKTIKWIKK